MPDPKSAKTAALVLNQPTGLKAIHEKKAIETSRPDRIINDLGLRAMVLKGRAPEKIETEMKVAAWNGAVNAGTMTKD